MISETSKSQKRMIIEGIVRELTQFTSNLIQLEKNAAELIATAKVDVSPQIASSLQSLDHMVQVSSSLGVVLSHLNDNEDFNLSEVLSSLTPQDLVTRLTESSAFASQSESRFEYF